MSHSRSSILSRLNCGRPSNVPLLQVAALGQETSVRSKCVPRRIAPGVLASPVKNPFGLQINRSWPIKNSLPLMLAFLPSIRWNPPTARSLYGPRVQAKPGMRKCVRPEPVWVELNRVCLPPSPLSRIIKLPQAMDCGFCGVWFGSFGQNQAPISNPKPRIHLFFNCEKGSILK